MRGYAFSSDVLLTLLASAALVSLYRFYTAVFTEVSPSFNLGKPFSLILKESKICSSPESPFGFCPKSSQIFCPGSSFVFFCPESRFSNFSQKAILCYFGVKFARWPRCFPRLILLYSTKQIFYNIIF